MKTGPAFPHTRRRADPWSDEVPPHWIVQAVLGTVMAGGLLLACFL